MRVYFYGPQTEDYKIKAAYEIAEHTLDRENIEYARKIGEEQNFSTETVKRDSKKNGVLFAGTDGFIIEVSTLSNEVSYILAFAALQKKPVLCLYKESGQPQGIPENLQNAGKISGVAVKPYTEENLPKVLISFLRKVQKSQAKDVPNIKFTLRISERIESYLHWKATGRGKSKAVYLRELLKEMMENDAEYQKDHK
ncbi:MAG: hypothetical protein ABIE68_01105 [bacterium]